MQTAGMNLRPGLFPQSWGEHAFSSKGIGGRAARVVRAGDHGLAITVRLLQQFRRDHRTLALLFGAPLLILSLLGYLLRGGASVPTMGIVNQDSGQLGQVVTTQLEQSKSVSTGSNCIAPTAICCRPSSAP